MLQSTKQRLSLICQIGKMYDQIRKYNRILAVGLIFLSCSVKAQTKTLPAIAEDLNTILASKDSLFFRAVFTTCDLNAIETILAKDFVFYRDNGYGHQTTTQTSKEFVEKIKQGCARKSGGFNMRREVDKSSLQVLPVSAHQAIQTGVQRFYLITEGQKDQLVEESKFSRQWHKGEGSWKLASELDFAINTKFPEHNASALYQEIARLDSAVFGAFNRRDQQTFQSLFAEDLEFFHDKGGLTGYQHSIDFLKKTAESNNDLKRQLVKGSLEVYPIPGYGAMQFGEHQFCHTENGKQDCGTFKFIHIWKKINNDWKITRVISYAH